MKKTLLVLALAVGLKGQTQRSVTLTWTDTRNPSGTTYSVYRANGLCSGTPTFNKLASSVADKTYLDNTVTPGNYCYYVTATYNNSESAASNQALAPVNPFAVTNLQVNVPQN